MADPAAVRRISVIVPAYNEAAALADHLPEIFAYGAARSLATEVLVVDDGSTDGSAELLGELARDRSDLRLLRQPRNLGKGAAVRRGLLAASGEIRGFTDADAATRITELDRLLPAFASGAGVVIGSRARRGEGVVVEAKLHRKVMGRVFNAFLRLLLGLRDVEGRTIADTQCGFKWLTAGAAQAIFSRAVVDGFAFDVELLYLANRLALPVVEVPVNWTDRGTSSVNLAVEPFRMLAAALSIARRHRGVTP
jgi:dolichyl-phosphate beta-glucosyltransferase